MINIIWVSMFVIGVVFAMVNGTMTEVNEAIFSGAKEAVTICIGLISVLAFWLGMMKIAEKAGLLDGLGKLLRPLARRLFPDVPVNDPAMGYILSNITANLFG
ncbi:MAG TPA: spore maturation protein, partial [Bacilli bacterium]|nr:spore maturation protein [Bacilli bacterium]